MKKATINILLAVALVLVAAISYVIGGLRADLQDGFAGTDSLATRHIEAADPDYVPWSSRCSSPRPVRSRVVSSRCRLPSAEPSWASPSVGCRRVVAQPRRPMRRDGPRTDARSRRVVQPVASAFGPGQGGAVPGVCCSRQSACHRSLAAWRWPSSAWPSCSVPSGGAGPAGTDPLGAAAVNPDRRGDGAVSVSWEAGLRFQVTPASLAMAEALAVRALAATLATFTLACSTPMVDLFAGLRKAHVPDPDRDRLTGLPLQLRPAGQCRGDPAAQVARLGTPPGRRRCARRPWGSRGSSSARGASSRRLEAGLGRPGYEDALRTLEPTALDPVPDRQPDAAGGAGRGRWPGGRLPGDRLPGGSRPGAGR